MGLQIALVLVALTNSLYWTTHKTRLYVKQLGKKWTHRLIWVYVLCLIVDVVTAFKLTFASSIFAGYCLFSTFRTRQLSSLDRVRGQGVAGPCSGDPVLFGAYQRRIEVPLTISMGASGASGGQSGGGSSALDA